jgi:hypothetical protein
MRSSGTHARRYLAVAGVLCVLLAGGCSKSASSGTSAATTAGTAAGTGAAAAACTLLTKAEVAQATGHSIAFSKQANLRSVSACTFGSLSGFAVVLSVTSSPAAGLSSDIPGLGNLVSRYHLTPVSGIGDEAFSGADAAPGSGARARRMVTLRSGRCGESWNGSWNGSPGNLSAVSAISAITGVICACRAHVAWGRSSHNPPVVGSSPTRPTSSELRRYPLIRSL